MSAVRKCCGTSFKLHHAMLCPRMTTGRKPEPDWRSLCARMAEALRYAHRWMEHGCTDGPCEIRDVLDDYATANSSKNLESSDATKTGQSTGMKAVGGGE